MVKIIVDVDCGNSPKQTFIKDYNIAFAEGNIHYLIEHVSDEVVWEMIGDKRIAGKDAFLAELEQMQDTSIAVLVIKSVVTHGKEAAADGELRMTNGDHYAFSDVYQFTSAKGDRIKTIRSYVIKVNP